MAIPFDQLTDTELLDIANDMMDSLMQASTEKDYAKHIQYFVSVLKVYWTKRNLKLFVVSIKKRWVYLQIETL